MNIEIAKKNKVLNVKTKKSLMFATRYFFKKRYNRKFVVNQHHELICTYLEKVLNGEITRLIINIAPRYSKTELAVKNFIAHALSLNPAAKFIHLSGSSDLALDNSEEIKDIITSDYYRELYPEVELKKDSKAKKKWYTTKGGGVYATSAGGQVTGFGAGEVDEEDEDIEEFISEIELKETFGGAIIIDDPIKPEDAESATIRERVNNRFDSTIRNRVNSRKTPIIIIMQRLHPDDLCGHLIKNDLEEWTVLALPSIYEEDGVKKALWPFKHTLQELGNIRGKTKASINIFDRQYMQNPKPIKGLMYGEFKTYTELPTKGKLDYLNYTDTADTGSDFLCSICYLDNGHLKYVQDILYTQEAMEETEKTTAVLLLRNNTRASLIESNNGGRGFARVVQAKVKGHTVIKWFHQSKNKMTRIFTNRHQVNDQIVFPYDWHVRWPEFYDHVTGYMSEGKNAFDDAPDTLTGMVENKVNKPFVVKTR